MWVVGVVAGFALLAQYAARPGQAVGTPNVDAASQPRQMRLCLFLHPHCPCSSATLKELTWILDHTSNDFTCEVYFVRPNGVPETWHESSLWRAAKSLARIQVDTDEFGRLAKRFGAKTSGHVMLFDSDGKALFSGGITVLRGHQGDNLGRRKLLDRLRKSATEMDTHVVFGCPLLSVSEESSKVDES